MPVKKSRKPAPPVKYLLSGDRKLQRLSLKKISDPTRAKPRARTTRGKPATDEKPGSPTPSQPIAGRFVIVGAFCLFAAAALLAARQPPPSSLRGHGATSAPQEAQALWQPARQIASGDTNTTATASPKRSATSAAARPTPTLPSIERSAASAPVKTTRTAKAASSSGAASPAPALESTAAVKGPPRLTVEGCLESDGQTYRLNNTTGLDAPKARTWRTGFLMKRSSTIGLVDATGRLRLQDHIGRRVAATGTVVDREMQATTLREVAASCR